MSNDGWATPPALVRRISHTLGLDFDLDVCASDANHKALRWYTEEQDGLALDWRGVCWMNPPYSKPGPWCAKAVRESKRGAIVVGLVPASTDSRWWHESVMEAASIYLLNKRVRF